MNNETETDRKFNPTLAPLFLSKGGTGIMSWVVNTETFDKFAEHLKVGARIMVKPNPKKLHENSPEAYLEIIPSEQVAEFSGQQENNEDAI